MFVRVWSVRYNASYDQLVLTCSSDQRVILSNLPSIASQPFGTMVDHEDTPTIKEEKDKLVHLDLNVVLTSNTLLTWAQLITQPVW